MNRLLAAFVLTVAVASGGVRDADAKCAQPILVDQFVVTAAKGAVIVSTIDTSSDLPTMGALRFTADGKKAAFDKVVHAPGLIAYRLPAGAKKGAVDDGKMAKATVTPLDPATPALAAPKVKTIVHTVNQSGRGSNERTIVTIEGNAPADAMAIVITDGDGKALSWGAIEKGEALTPYYRGRCGILPDGTEPPADKAKVFWVDKYGRASAMSNATKVTTKREGNGDKW